MTDPEQPADPTPLEEDPKEKTFLDELYRWRWILLLLLPIGIGAAWVFSWSIPWELLTIAVLVGLASIGAAVVVGLPIVLRRADPPAQKAIFELDPRGEYVRLRVHFLDPDESINVRWGEAEPIPGTAVPCWMVRCFRPETNEAWGTERSVKDPDVFERELHRVDEYYGELEVEATQKRVLESTVRTAARRAAMAMVSEQDRLMDEATVPGGDVVTETLDELLPDRPDEPGDDQDDDQEEPDVAEWMETSAELAENPELPAADVAEAATDGGMEHENV